MVNTAALLALLANANEDTIVHIAYIAGRPATAKACVEFDAAKDWNADRGVPATTYIGHFAGFKTTKKGDTVLTLFVHNRGEAGQFRAFNPNLGTILSVEIDPATAG
jgi:hypothetical protein